MKLYRIIFYCLASIVVCGGVVTSCQKLHRPELGKILLDPDPPVYNALKSYWQFEGNTTDEGENKLSGTSKNVTYVPGISGQALKIGIDGYLLLKAVGDTVKYPNEFVGLPVDTLKNLGSFTVAFWMFGVGPVQGGAQGVFSFSNSNEFWGNLDLFLENYSSPTDPNAAHLKIHMFNGGVASGNGEEWTADDNMKLGNVLNKWTHIGITYDAATSKISVYKDGAATATINKTLGGGNYGKIKFNNFNGLVLGTHHFQTTPSLTNHGPESWAKSFNGSLDQFRIYNKALSAAEITNLFTTKK